MINKNKGENVNWFSWWWLDDVWHIMRCGRLHLCAFDINWRYKSTQNFNVNLSKLYYIYSNFLGTVHRDWTCQQWSKPLYSSSKFLGSANGKWTHHKSDVTIDISCTVVFNCGTKLWNTRAFPLKVLWFYAAVNNF